MGNGFDLAHYLPTAYVHFMDAMMIIESYEGDKELGFDDLFQKYLSDECSDRDKEFFRKTKELYKIDDLNLSTETVKDLQEKLKNNGWFQHFKHHLTDVDTWIDFENEIENSLNKLREIFDINFLWDSIIVFDSNTMNSSEELEYHNIVKDNEIVLSPKFFNEKGNEVDYYWALLIDFGLVRNVYMTCENFNIYKKSNQSNYYYEPKNIREISTYDHENKSIRYKKEFKSITDKFLFKRFRSKYIGFDENKIFKVLTISLEEFIDIFEEYISLVINSFNPKVVFNSFLQNESVFSFNYSDIFQRFYQNTDSVFLHKVNHLHGRAKDKNIVLGISDLNDNLKKYKVFSFVKTYQKLINNTDYKFLENTELKVVRSVPREIGQLRSKYEVIIWGHSLDASDAEYIREIFSLNDEKMLNRIAIKVWYHDKPHTQLANLMHVMGKDIIQEWMKKDWLVFEEAPDIYKENNKGEQI